MTKKCFYDGDKRTHGTFRVGSVPNLYQNRKYYHRKYEAFGLQSLLRRKIWLENILFTKHIKEYSSRKAACLFVDYQKLKEALKRKEEILA